MPKKKFDTKTPMPPPRKPDRRSKWVVFKISLLLFGGDLQKINRPIFFKWPGQKIKSTIRHNRTQTYTIFVKKSHGAGIQISQIKNGNLQIGRKKQGYNWRAYWSFYIPGNS